MSQQQGCAQQQDLLQAAEELRRKRDSERETLSKSQLKKRRRQLSRLYQQALNNSMHHGTASQPDTQPADPTDEDLQASWNHLPAASEFTDASIAGGAAPSAPIHGGAGPDTEPGLEHESPPPVQSPTPTAAHTHTSKHTVFKPPVAGPATLRIPVRPVLPPSGRGRHMDMSGVMHALKSQLAPGGPTHAALTQPPPSQPPRAHPATHAPAATMPADSQTQELSTSRAAQPTQQGRQKRPLADTAAAPPASDISAPSTSEATTQPAKRPRKQYVYGNYHGYYGYRHASVGAFEDDPRLALLQPEWFTGKHMLDVGCNEGLVTLAAAVRWGPASTTGVDIDKALIGKACRNLRSLRANMAEQLKLGPTKQTATAATEQQGPSQQVVASLVVTSEQQASVGMLQPSHCSDGTGLQSVLGMEATVCATERVTLTVTTDTTGVASGVAAEESLVDEDMALAVAVAVAEETVDTDGSEDAEENAGDLADVAADSDEELCQGSGEGGCQVEQVAVEGQAGVSGQRQRQQQAGLQPGPSCTSSWWALRTAAKALSAVQFHTQDWANQEEPELPPSSRQLQGRGRGRQQQKRGRVRKTFGVILCLSVTKWVHVNWGDEGLMRLFHKFQRSLDMGGHLILEPQPWRSYESALVKRRTSGVAAHDLMALRMRPEQFPELLTQELGFELVGDLNQSSTAVGFDRPLYVFKKVRHVGKSVVPRFLGHDCAGAGRAGPESAVADETEADAQEGQEVTQGSGNRGAGKGRGGGSRWNRRQHRPEDLLSAGARDS